MKLLQSRAGFTLISSLIGAAMAIMSVWVFATYFRAYTSSKKTINANSLVFEIRSALAPKLTQITRLLFSKNCVSGFGTSPSGSPSDPRYLDIFNAAVKDYGAVPFFRMSMNDLMITSNFGGLSGLGRPARFTTDIQGITDKDYLAALYRCDAAQSSVNAYDTSFYGCYQFAALDESALNFQGQSIMQQDTVLIEIKLEFVDLKTYQPISCSSMPSNKKAGVISKTRVYWRANSERRKATDVFAFAR